MEEVGCDLKKTGSCIRTEEKKCWRPGGACAATKSCKDKAYCGHTLGLGKCGNCAHDRAMRAYEAEGTNESL